MWIVALALRRPYTFIVMALVLAAVMFYLRIKDRSSGGAPPL